MPGIRADYVHPLEPRYVCGLCELVIRSPMQTNCGHIFCKECLQEAMSSGKMLCPLDDDEISQIFPDNACKREIQKLEVRCRYAKNNGCPWTGTLSTEDVHHATCEYRDEQCPGCSEYMIWTEIKRHAELECPMRMTVCQYCSESFPLSYEKSHVQRKCLAVELPCPNNCNPNYVMKRKELNKHLSVEDGDCPFSEIDCPYKPLGCDFTAARSLLDKHMQEDKIRHQQMLIKAMTTNAQQNSHLVKVVKMLENQLSSLGTRVSNLEKDHDTSAQRIKDLEERAQSQFTRGIGFLEEPLASRNRPVSTLTPSMGTGAAVLPSGDVQLLQRVPELFTAQEELSKAVEKLMSSSDDQQLRIQLLEQATHNGVLVWKIDEVSRKMDEAVKGITVSLFSAPFYSDPRGYKMCARCYLNGDGTGKGTHLSLFFVVMKGLYDGLLRWPFRQRVTMTLLNLSGGRDESDTFIPDPCDQLPSFQRPVNTRDTNIPSGFPQFIPLQHFRHGGFIKEDCIFVKVAVDCSDLCGSSPTDMGCSTE